MVDPTPDPDPDFREAADDDLDRVVSLVEAAGLPTADLRGAPATFVLAAPAGTDDPVAVGGLERAGDAALLRSVVVAPDARGEGVGRALVGDLESRAAAEARDCYLLTTDAAGFFARLGYERVDRAAAPEGVRRTRQFEGLCPDAATLMRKRLPEPSE